MDGAKDIRRTFEVSGTRPFEYAECARQQRDDQAVTRWSLLVRAKSRLLKSGPDEADEGRRQVEREVLRDDAQSAGKLLQPSRRHGS